MEICVLGSGSSGNCIYVAAGGTRLLVDAGLRLRTLRARLALLNCAPADIDAVLLTHEHVDHCVGLANLSRHCPALRLLANEGTAAGVESVVRQPLGNSWDIFETGTAFEIGALRVESFPVPHDTGDPVAYVLDDGIHRLGVATDFGISTPVVRRHLHDCDALILETNHDVEMLRQSGRPWSLIQRILGHHGHLSNEQAAELLAEVAGPRLKTIFPAHLSADCNTPDLADYALRRVLRELRRDDIIIEPTHRGQASACVRL
ncbi:MAG: MBL fold metallo-hydrolase [Kiritimatiellae bacterium]|nr:MBL fold metallo-hydrolase [Kiritimatiellia bacterium]